MALVLLLLFVALRIVCPGHGLVSVRRIQGDGTCV